MTWFESLFGFREGTPDQVRAAFDVEGETIVSRANGRRFVAGRLEVASLADLRARRGPAGAQGPQLREVVADVQALHRDPANAGALFQVASQFNLLEMVGPEVTPDQGITRYAHDRTQGPACAIACAAGTLWRACFAPVNGQAGQSKAHQIDTLADLGAAVGNAGGSLWDMRNGYALPRPGGLARMAEILSAASEADRDRLRGLLRIGLHWGTEVTLEGAGHLVSQAYCSALPVAYGTGPARQWEPFAQLVLEAAYEATLLAAAENAARGQPLVFLTLLGGGAFGNQPDWIADAVVRAVRLAGAGLDIRIVSYGRPSPTVAAILSRLDGAG